MDTKYMASQVAESLASDVVPTANTTCLLDEMIQNGKIFYVKESLIPHEPDSIKWGFSAAQVKWCEENEQEIWSYLLQKKLLFETDRNKFRKLVEESPNAGDSPPALREAPGRVGNWLGYRIVSAWARRHPGDNLQAIFAQRDARKLLEEAKYKPKKKG
jgi:hypothetical protein